MTLTEAKEVIRRAVDHPDELVMSSVLREAGAVLLVAHGVPDKRLCHSPVDSCLGCPHYYGKAKVCSYAIDD